MHKRFTRLTLMSMLFARQRCGGGGHLCVCMWIYECICICVYVHMYVCIYVCLCIYVCVYMYVYVWLYVCAYMCLYVYMHIVCTYVQVYEEARRQLQGSLCHPSWSLRLGLSLGAGAHWSGQADWGANPFNILSSLPPQPSHYKCVLPWLMK